jgi:hypothetical protein
MSLEPGQMLSHYCLVEKIGLRSNVGMMDGSSRFGKAADSEEPFMEAALNALR